MPLRMSHLCTRYAQNNYFMPIDRHSLAYTFSYYGQEDTLACILALDGFFMDGRNIRASYGTSKYCSAFIKNVRCNNPDCTYLHCMGDAEDTFTKQEIQAGYVTSGRDVLARQQQIVAEALSAAGGASGAGTRRKVGGGGPSGTGKASLNPVFPPPCYDEPLKPSIASLVPTPAPVNRSMSVGGAMASAAPIPIAGKISRSVSVSSGSSPAIAATKASPPASVSSNGSSTLTGLGCATAASVVAGVRSVGNATAGTEPPAAHTTLTPLTPLKRTGRGKSSSSLSQDGSESAQLPPAATKPSKLSSLRNSSSQKSSTLKNGLYGTAPTSPSSSVSSTSALASHNNDFCVGSIGGSAIGPPGSADVGGNLIGSSSSLGNPIGGHGDGLSLSGGNMEGSGALGGEPIGHHEPFATSSSIGGEVFTGQLPSRSDSAIGNSKDRWKSAAPGDRGSGLFGSSGSLSIGGGDIWGNEGGGGMTIGRQSGHVPGIIGGSSGSLGSIGPGDGGFAPGSSFNPNPGSSALASMLGISLPTGNGSLQETSSLWNGPSSLRAPVSSLHGGSAPGVIGVTNRAPGGGMSIGGSGAMPSGVLRGSGRGHIGGGNNSDIALLQSLLPGVHITSGNAKQPAAPGSSVGGGGWNPMADAPIGQPLSNNGAGFGIAMPPQGDSWGGASVGSSGYGTGQGGRQQEQNRSGIW